MNKILEEKYLPSEFKWGFELEAIAKYKEISDEIDSYNKSDIEEFIADYISDHFDISDDNLYLDDDYSINTKKEDDISFEWASPVLDFNPKTIYKVVNFLSNMFNSELFYTNKSCGFHIHISFPDISKKDAIWIIAKLAVDDNMKEKLKKFGNILFVHNEPVDSFSSGFANDKFLEDIKEKIENGKYEFLKNLITNEKFRMIRIHPQGTLEWRGPRNFLNDGGNIKKIYSFMKKLVEFILWISNVLDEKEINGISRDNFMKLAFPYDEYNNIKFEEKFETEKYIFLNNRIEKYISNNNYEAFYQLFKKSIIDKKLKDIFNYIKTRVFELSKTFYIEMIDYISQKIKTNDEIIYFCKIFGNTIIKNLEKYIQMGIIEKLFKLYTYDDKFPYGNDVSNAINIIIWQAYINEKIDLLTNMLIKSKYTLPLEILEYYAKENQNIYYSLSKTVINDS